MKLVWIDLETTGLDASTCQIIEAACVITDEQFNILGQYSSIINPGNLNYESTALNMHKTSGLFTKVASGKALVDVATDILELIKLYEPRKQRAYLAGSSVHFDRKFIAKYMPMIDIHMCSRHLDVNAVGLAMRIKYGKELSEYIATKSHRALEDIGRSIQELKYYMDAFTKPVNELN